MMLRREALADAGTMDEGYFLHCEDLDLCVRFRERGWDVLFDPLSRAVHLKGVSSQRRPLAVEWHKHRGMLRYFEKHFRKRYPVILVPLVHLAVWVRFTLVCIPKWIQNLCCR
jgi:GT2 family glycosyltransferase